MTNQRAPVLDLQIIQAQIQHNGAFSPLHWLLQTGYLSFADYECWRKGEIASLDGLFSISRENLQTLVDSSVTLAKALKLAAEPQLFFSWGARHGDARHGSARHEDARQHQRHLKLSDSKALADWLGQRWLRPEDVPQMDLFMDSGAAVAENELTDLLCQRRWDDAEQAYHQLSERAPGNSHLAQYETLILYGKHMSASEQISEEQACEELMGLLHEIAPVANDLLRHQAGDYLSVAWQRLAKNLPLSHFNSEQPQFHASFALAQLPAWPAVVAAIKEVAEFERYPALIMRLAEAYWYQQPEIALLLWCKVADLDEDAETWLDTISHARFNKPWSSFWELDLSVVFFPAYLLIQEPGLLHLLAMLPTSEPQHPAFAAVKKLLLSRGNEEKQVDDRKELQAISPELLQIFLKPNE